jgi:CheY-like chemotaxis protein/HPt (histidine-containing phosphotransfer) domain-containing protein
MTPIAFAQGDAMGELVSACVEKPIRRARLLEVLSDVVCGPPDQAALPTPDEEARPPAAGARILVIEDTPINQLAATSMLQELGYHADVVESGHAGLAALQRDSYAAVLMDCQMAGLDGFQTTAEIRGREGAGSRTPVIAMTASAMLGDRERCLAAGMDDYLAKPVRLKALAAALGRWVPRVAGHGSLEAQTLVDLDRLASRGQPDVVDELVALFRQEAPRRVAALQAALDADDAEALRQAAHKLRGTAAAVGAREVCDLSGEIERWARRGDVGPARLLIEGELPRAMQEACDALDALLETQGGATCAS